MKYLKLFGSAFIVGSCVSICYDFVKWFGKKHYYEGQRHVSNDDKIIRIRRSFK